MASTALTDLLAYLRRVHGAHAARDLTDGQLLQRFIAEREDAAFTALVRRHGPMVMGVCNRVLGDAHAAEDSFQATFLVLARRAASIRKRVTLGSWLYGVAQRIALRAKGQTTARRLRETQVQLMPRSAPLDDVTWQELREVLDEEIGRLPEKYRAPIVLCYMQGMTHEQAAQMIGCPKRTLTSRLERGREMLRQQLTGRGISLSAGVLATAMCEKMAAARVSALLTMKTVKGGISFARGKACGWSVCVSNSDCSCRRSNEGEPLDSARKWSAWCWRLA